MPDIEQTIKLIEQDMADAFNRGDIDAILGFFDPEFVGFSSTAHERLHGLKALRKTFVYYLKQGEGVDFQLDEVEVNTFGPVAVATFYWSVTMKSHGKEHEVVGRGSHVFVQRDSQWKIVHEHFSRAHHKPEVWDSSPG